MKEEYKNGTMVWCQCIGWSTKKLYYEGPARINNSRYSEILKKKVYYVVLPFRVETGTSSFELGEEQIKYVIE